MSDFEYKLNSGDTLNIGDSSNTVAIAGSASITKNVYNYEEVTTTGSSDVVDPSKYVSLVTSAGAHTVTLPNGTYVGQVKKVILTVDGGTVTLTPASLAEGTSITMADVFDSVELIWDGTNWNIAQASGIALV